MARYKWSDSFKGQWRSLRNGTGGNFGATYREVKRARDERVEAERNAQYPLAEGSGWYSKYKSASGKIDVMVDKNGNPTNSYPHVHVIHDERGGEVVVVRSMAKKDHPERIVLPGNASGNQVNAAVAEMLKRL